MANQHAINVVEKCINIRNGEAHPFDAHRNTCPDKVCSTIDYLVRPHFLSENDASKLKSLYLSAKQEFGPDV